MQDVGFDYGLTPRQAGDALIAGAQVLWEKELVFDIQTGSPEQSADTTESASRIDG